MTQRRRIRATVLLAGLLALAAFVHSCVPESIGNLRLAGARRVPASSLPKSSMVRDALVGRGETVWRLTFEGDADWPREVKQHALNGYAIVVRCDRPDAGVFSVGPYVGQVEISSFRDGFDTFDAGAARTLKYDIYVPETGAYRSEADFNAPMPKYDLGRERLQLCVRIAGGSMLGAYGRSNEVRVSIGPAAGAAGR